MYEVTMVPTYDMISNCCKQSNSNIVLRLRIYWAVTLPLLNPNVDHANREMKQLRRYSLFL